MLAEPGVRSLRVLLLARVDAADDRRLAVVDEHGRDGALGVDRRNAVDLRAPKSGVAFSSAIFMMTVPAAVICGVTFSVSAASLNVTVTVLLDDRLNRNLDALRDLGLDVVLRRDARRRQHAAVAGCSSAVSATSRLNAPLTDPSARPTALVGAPTPRFTAVGCAARPLRRRRRGRRALPLFGNARFVVLPSAGSTRPLKPHWTPSARAKFLFVWTMRASISTCGCALSSVLMQSIGGRQPVLQVGDDERVGARIDLHRAALRQRALGQQRLQILGLRVAQRPGQHAQLAGERLLVGELAALRLLRRPARSAARCGRSCRRRGSRACWRAG